MQTPQHFTNAPSTTLTDSGANRRIDRLQVPPVQVLDYSKPRSANGSSAANNLCTTRWIRHLASRAEQAALISTVQRNRRGTFLYLRELHREVNRCAAVLQAWAVKQGERVVILYADDRRSGIRDARLRPPGAFIPWCSAGSRRTTWPCASTTPSLPVDLRRCGMRGGKRCPTRSGRYRGPGSEFPRPGC